MCYSMTHMKLNEVVFVKVQCVLCDEFHTIDAYSLQAKRLRNRRIQMYLCETCDHRIKTNTNARHATGNFHLYKEKMNKDDLF